MGKPEKVHMVAHKENLKGYYNGMLHNKKGTQQLSLFISYNKASVWFL